jgi:acyl carrier protein
VKLSAEQVVEFLRSQRNLPDLTASTPLFSDDTLDSLALLDLITHLQDTVGLEVLPEDVTIENFDTAERVEAFVESRLRGRSTRSAAEAPMVSSDPDGQY